MNSPELPKTALTQDAIRKAPKVVLHEHLDGGLRPQTIIEIADEIGHPLPAHEPEALKNWFFEAADSGTLERYLETFAHTVAVMQRADDCFRVASEAAQDLAADGVVYAELRYAPEQQLLAGLSLEEVVEATLAGFEEGQRLAAAAGSPITVRTLLCGMRHADRTKEIAELAVAYRDKGVVGFDIAGGEIGNPAERHVEAFDYLRRENMPFTIHAGESCGPESIWGAVAVCGANRIGHGVQLIKDIDLTGDEAKLSNLAHYIRDRRIALEVAPSSNLQTEGAESIETHPIKALYDLGFRVTVNNDNRLQSRTSVSREFQILSETFGWGWAEVKRCTENAMKASFLHHPERRRILAEVIRPAYAALESTGAE
ncbi:adenosine deaminase [Glycomyces algeriensis]|uniref:adenosine deaminase n=1 Tax=Glycomyces algeriensis TaxID=256037 RepID=A0A9W6G580_9ACTN|nr:adenosine deaminase [Glycomyces algeriensis]MDA1367760.1 adenosine deaminase [Glycomyces algeriensis]MDR7352876.1 adenosine deaminase [Glycomyces algeriensis]GLI40563.1 adenosine deaminase [Glycomyces algeriensis]